jgi:hypothetical protein
MFNKKFEDRLRAWVDFRETLEVSSSPIEDTIKFYSYAPMVNMQVDPWDPKSWLTPWELLRENRYCEFSKILAICYTLQLTDSFLESVFKIHICTNTVDSEVKYLLFVDDKVIGFDLEKVIKLSDLPNTLRIEIVYNMQSLQ